MKIRSLMTLLAGMCAASFTALVNADWPMTEQGNEEAMQGHGGTIHHPGQDSSEDFPHAIFIVETGERVMEERYPSDTANIMTVINSSGEIPGVTEVTNVEPVASDLQSHSQSIATVIKDQMRSEAMPITQKTVSSDSQSLPTSTVPKPELHVMLLVGLGLVGLSLRRRTHFTHR